MSVTWKVEGFDKVRRALEQFGRDVRNAAPRALRGRAEGVMTTAKRTTVPVAPDGGTLRASGYVEEPVWRGLELEVTLGFGGPAAPYAAAVHEHESEHSPPSWKGKTIDFHLGGEVGHKFLERPLFDALPNMLEELAVEIAP